MIIIQIDNREEKIIDVDQFWIKQQINRRREDGLSPQVIIKIKESGIDIVLSTPNAFFNFPTTRRIPNGKEQRIFDLWNKFDLNKIDFSCEKLILFIQNLNGYL